MEKFTIVYYRDSNLEGVVLDEKNTDLGKRYLILWKHSGKMDWYSESFVSQSNPTIFKAEQQ